MHGHEDAVVSTMLGFALTSTVMLPPILSERSEKAARIAAHDTAIAASAADFGAERQARLARLLRNVGEPDRETEIKQLSEQDTWDRFRHGPIAYQSWSSAMMAAARTWFGVRPVKRLAILPPEKRINVGMART